MSVIGPEILAWGQTLRIISKALLRAMVVRCGSRDFSKRWRESVRIPSLEDVLRTGAALKFADSIRMEVVFVVTPLCLPPMMPAIASGFS